MYTKNNKLITSENVLGNYIEGSDVYNSSLLSKLSDLSLKREYFEIITNEYRPDLIAADFYGSEDYLGILLMQCKMPLSGFTRGTYLKLITKDEIDNILKSLG